jgi:hypothetical protein
MILWLGRQLVSDSPWQEMRADAHELARVMFVGTLIAVVLGTIGLVISSLTDRKAIAVTIIFLGFVGTTGFANGALVLLEDQPWSRYLILVSVLDTFEGIYDHVIEDNVTGSAIAQANLPLGVYLGYVVSLVMLGIAFLRWRYRLHRD